MKKKILVLILGLLLIAVNLYAAGDLIVEGNAGVGTTTPGAKLEIVGTSDISQLIVRANSSQSNTNPIVKLQNNSGTDLFWLHSDDPSNLFIGVDAGRSNYISPDNGTGFYNIFIGPSAGYSNIDGGGNFAMGSLSLYSNISGGGNFAMGYLALYNNTTGENNIGIGQGAIYRNASGSQNTAIGSVALFEGVGSNNTVIGYNAGSGVYGSSFSNNSLFGVGTGNVLTTGSNNLLLGYQAGDNLTTGANNIIIGYDLDAPLATSANTLNIGNLIFATGVNGTGTTLSTGNVGVGTTAPNTKVDIDGDVALRAGAFTATNGNNNNINIGGKSFIRITGPTAAFTVTGIAGGVDGKVVILYNATTFNMTIANESSSSTDINRITTLTGSGVVTTGAGAITLIYDSTASRWIVTSARL